jgi:serine phosphatase RsbU (regulator of sigma subunit)
VAVHHAVGERGASAGGDWCDVIRFADGRPGLLIGDVMGRGLAAAAAMGQLRAAVIALSHVSDGPAALLRRLDAVADRFPGAEMATIGCMAIDPAGGRITHASAGHLPPLLITDGGATFLWGGRSLPLGVAPETDRREESWSAPPGTIALLFTDGLIEQRGETIDAGLARLIDAASAAQDRSAGGLIDAVLEVGSEGSQDDDVAVIAARIETPGACR